jgi:hypothetical protein
VSGYLQPAYEQSLVSRDSEGGYNIRTERGGLRIVPPTESEGNYRIEYHATPAIAEQATTAPLSANQERPVNYLSAPTFREESPTDSIPVSTVDPSPILPADSLHKTLQHFIKSGQEKTEQSGQAVHVWNNPDTVGQAGKRRHTGLRAKM